MRGRVRPPQQYEELIDRLVGEQDGVFKTKAKALLFAAAIGYVKHPQEADNDHALAVAAHDNLDVLAADRQPDRVALFEQYAYLGLSHLQQACYGDPRPEHPVEGLLRLLDDLARPPGEVLPGLDDVF